MPAVARSNGQDTVFSLTGTGKNCMSPVTTVTGAPSCQVFVNGHPIVRIDDQVASHPYAGCSPDMSTLTTSSSTVFIGGKGLGRIGDQYTSDNTIISGSSTVFCG